MGCTLRMPSKPRPSRSPDELRRASVHVFHELEMLLGIPLRMARRPEDVTKWALLESFLIHARALHHFLWPAGRKDDDDVLARDFFGGTWPNAPAEPTSAAMVKLRDDANKYIAHVSYRRPDPGGEKEWDITGIADEFRASFDCFRADVPSTLLDDRWRKVLPGRPNVPIVGSTTNAAVGVEYFTPPLRKIDVTQLNAVSSSVLRGPLPGSTTDPLAGRAYRDPDDPDPWGTSGS